MLTRTSYLFTLVNVQQKSFLLLSRQSFIIPAICLHRWPAMEAVVKLMIRHMVVLGSDSDIFERTILNVTALVPAPGGTRD